MREFAEKLSGRKQTLDTSSSDSAIFGTSGITRRTVVADPNLHRFRVGLWPIISQSDPESAMGLSLVLALLLERWEPCRPTVYLLRLMERQMSISGPLRSRSLMWMNGRLKTSTKMSPYGGV